MTTPIATVVGRTSTYSKAAFSYLPDYPDTFFSASGCHVYGRKTNSYHSKQFIDFTASLGAVITEYIKLPITLPPALPGPTQLEQDVATLLTTYLPPNHFHVRFAKNGSDATAAAVRIAREYRTSVRSSHILTNSYHGSSSDLLNATPNKSGGVLVDTRDRVIRCPTPARLIKLLTDPYPPCAVIMEPLTPTCQSWPLEQIRRICTDRNILLIFDEILTGYRLRPGSSSPHVVPDLYCFGKAIANGAPLSALVGPSHLMDLLLYEVFMSNTAAGDTHALHYAHSTLTYLNTTDLYPSLLVWGQQVRDALSGIVTGYPTRLTLTLPEPDHHRFLSSLAKNGILVGRDFFSLFSHLTHLTDHERSQILTTIKSIRKDLSI